MKLISKPYNLLGLSGVAFLLLIAFVNKDATVDIHMHDTMIIIATTHIAGISAAILLYLWLIYSFTFKILFSKILAWAHILATILFFLVFAFSMLQTQPNYFYTLNYILATFSLITFLMQMLFVVNIFAGLLKKLLRGQSR